jgi:carbon-monoxide dehydrogenase large subunit
MAITKVSWVGTSVERPEDDALLTGAEPYVADLELPGQLSAAIVRSSVAHGRLLSIDTAEATALEGVVAVYTAQDIAADLGAVPVIHPRLSFDDSLAPYLQPVMVEDRVRFVGEPLAIVVARNRYIAEDAAELVFADIEPLDPVLDAVAGGASIELFEGHSNVASTSRGAFGDVAAAVAGADVVVEAEIVVGRHSGIPMEGRGIVADADPATGRLTIHGSTKVPHNNRTELAALLGIPEASIRMLEMAAGGGFGIKGEFYPEDFLVPWASRKLGKPVAWVEDRREHMLTANHSRQQVHRATIAGTADGRVTAIGTEFWVDAGAYVRTVGTRVADLTIGSVIGPYDIANYSATGHSVLTNKTPTGTYRGPGRFESSFVMERLLDLFAARIGIGPIEVRRRNLIRIESMPYTRPLYSAGEPIVLEPADYEAMLDRVIEAADPEEVAARRAAGETVGLGVGTFLEKSGLGPWETARLDVTPGGEIRIWTGATSLGQGLRNVLVQVVADELDLAPDQITAAKLDTDLITTGIGTYASRSTVMSGGAAQQAAIALVALARTLAAAALGVDEDALELREGGFQAAGDASARVTLAELAAAAGDEGLSVEETFRVARVAYGQGALAAVVRVDPEIGAVHVERLVIGYDVGRAINPRIIEGQLQGAAVQALGGALLEEFVYDEDGNPLAASFMDYLLPALGDAPEMIVLIDEVPATTNPLGVKGAGEAGVPAIAGTIANAIEDAIGAPGTIRRTPITPERVADAVTALS